MISHVLHHIVPELIQEERRYVWPQVLRDEGDLLGCLDALYDLLRRPRPVLVDADHGEVRRNALKHRQTGTRRALLEQFLDDLDMSISISI